MAKKRTGHDGLSDLAVKERTAAELSLVLRAIAREYRDYGISGIEALSPQCTAGHARTVAMAVLKSDFKWDYAKIATHFNASTSRVIEEFEAIDWLEQTPYYKERLGNVQNALRARRTMEDRAASTSLCQFVSPVRCAVESAASVYGAKAADVLSDCGNADGCCRVLAAYAMRRYLMMRYAGIASVLNCSKSVARELCSKGESLCDDSSFVAKLALVRDEIDR